MKKYLSVFMLATSGLPGILGLTLGITTVCQGIAFGLSLYKHRSYYLLEDVFAGSYVGIFFRLGLIAMLALLALSFSSYQGSRIQYSLKRLRITEKETLLPFCMASILAILIFWALQSLYMVLLSWIYLQQASGDILHTQTVHLAFYRVPFLHCLVPLADIAGNLANAVWILCTGVALAVFSYHIRNGRMSLALPYMIGILFVQFRLPMGSAFFQYALCGYNLFVLGWTLWNVWRVKQDENG